MNVYTDSPVKYYCHLQYFCSVADQVLIGDEVLVQETHELTPSEVINISDSKMQGDYYCYYYCVPLH